MYAINLFQIEKNPTLSLLENNFFTSFNIKPTAVAGTKYVKAAQKNGPALQH